MVLSCAGLYVAMSGVGFEKLGAELSTVPWTLAIVIGAASIVASAIRSYRWKIAIESFSPVAFKNVFSAFMSGMFGLNVIPARVGEYLRVLVLGKNSSISQSSILATVVFERVMDGLTILTIFAAALVFRPPSAAQSLLGGVRREFLLLIPALFVLCLGFLYAVSRHPKKMMEIAARFSGRPGSFTARIPGMLERFSGGLIIFSDPGRLFRYAVWSFVAWFSIAFFYHLNFVLMKIPLGFAESIVVMAIVVVGVMIPAAPGFVGTYHAFCKAALVAFGVDETRALTFAVVTHAVPYILHTVVGFAFVVRENVRWIDLAAGNGAAAGPPAK